jgi:hypothetical protein
MAVAKRRGSLDLTVKVAVARAAGCAKADGGGPVFTEVT